MVTLNEEEEKELKKLFELPVIGIPMNDILAHLIAKIEIDLKNNKKLKK